MNTPMVTPWLPCPTRDPSQYSRRHVFCLFNKPNTHLSLPPQIPATTQHHTPNPQTPPEQLRVQGLATTYTRVQCILRKCTMHGRTPPDSICSQPPTRPSTKTLLNPSDLRIQRIPFGHEFTCFVNCAPSRCLGKTPLRTCPHVRSTHEGTTTSIPEPTNPCYIRPHTLPVNPLAPGSFSPHASASLWCSLKRAPPSRSPYSSCWPYLLTIPQLSLIICGRPYHRPSLRLAIDPVNHRLAITLNST